VTPTNLVFNVVSIPGALFRYGRRASLRSPLTALLLLGTLPGVIAGALIRVFLLPDARTFQVVASSVLLPLGVSLCLSVRRPTLETPPLRPLSTRWIAALALVVGVVGGVYGIGGGSLISPVLVRRGMLLSVVAPAALLSTWVTSVVGAITYAVIAIWFTGRPIAPRWDIGLLCGIGGLLGGFLGAHLQPKVSETVLRLVLGGLAVSTAVIYLVIGLSRAAG